MKKADWISVFLFLGALFCGGLMAQSSGESAVSSPEKEQNLIQQYTNFLKAHPLHVKSYIGRGQVKKRLKDYTGAIADFRRALELDPDNVIALYSRGTSLCQVGKFELAEKDLDAAVKVDTADGDLFMALGVARSGFGDYRGAEKAYARVVALAPENPFGYAMRADVRFKMHNDSGAAMDYSKTIELSPEDYLSYSARAEVRFSMGDYPGALLDCRKSSELKPGDPILFELMGRIFFMTEQYDSAAAAFSQAIALQEDFARAWGWRGHVYGMQGKDSAAIVNFNQALKLNPSDYRACYGRGAIRYKQHDLKGAIDDFSLSIELNGDNAQAYMMRGAAKLNSDDKSGCRDVEKAVGLGYSNVPEDIRKFCNMK
jgi:tetratricopeptide (TPR) repeat protein